MVTVEVDPAQGKLYSLQKEVFGKLLNYDRYIARRGAATSSNVVHMIRNLVLVSVPFPPVAAYD